MNRRSTQPRAAFERLVMALAFVPAAGCSEVLGVSDYRTVSHGPDAASPGPVPLAATSACKACVTRACEAELRACSEDEPCARWGTCLSSCAKGDVGCETRCYAPIADGGASLVTSGAGGGVASTNAAMGNLSACYDEHCAEPCGSVELTTSAFPAPCATKMRDVSDGCAAQLDACARDARCRDFWSCMMKSDCILTGGRNPNCVMRCEDATQFWGPNSTALDLGVCSAVKAYGGCKWDDVSSCAGYAWDSSGQSGSVTVFVQNGGKGVGGIEIGACMYGSTECVETQTTDPGGFATFEQVSGGYAAPYFELSPGWPNGPKQLLVNAGRPLPPGAFVSIPIGAQNLSQPWAPGKAAILAYPRGCYPGVIIAARTTLDPGAHGLQGGGVDGGTPSVTAWQFEGVEPGMRTITASVNGEPFAQATVMTKPDAFTFVPFLFPTAKLLGSK